jgi:Spy/CpxP family protein refolding chaperone
MKMNSISLLFVLLAAAGSAHADGRRDVALKALEQKAQLDPATAERAQQVVDRYRGPIAELRKADGETLRELRLLLRVERPDDKRIKKLADQLLTSRTKLQKVKAERLHDLAKVMSPSQFGRLLVSWQRVNGAIRRAHTIES